MGVKSTGFSRGHRTPLHIHPSPVAPGISTELVHGKQLDLEIVVDAFPTGRALGAKAFPAAVARSSRDIFTTLRINVDEQKLETSQRSSGVHCVFGLQPSRANFISFVASKSVIPNSDRRVSFVRSSSRHPSTILTRKSSANRSIFSSSRQRQSSSTVNAPMFRPTGMSSTLFQMGKECGGFGETFASGLFPPPGLRVRVASSRVS